MGRNAIPELDELLEPREPELCKQFDVFPAISTTKDRENGKDKDVLEIMGLRSIDPRIFDNRHAFN
jgi:hypothetical protein